MMVVEVPVFLRDLKRTAGFRPDKFKKFSGINKELLCDIHSNRSQRQKNPKIKFNFRAVTILVELVSLHCHVNTNYWNATEDHHCCLFLLKFLNLNCLPDCSKYLFRVFCRLALSHIHQFWKHCYETYN